MFDFSARLRLLLAVSLAATAVPAFAEDTAARAVLDEAGAALKQLQAFRVESSIAYTGKYDDGEESRTTDYAITVNTAGDIALHVENDSVDMVLVADKDNVVRFMPPFEQYITSARDESVGALVKDASFEIIDPAVDALAALAAFQMPTEGQVVRDLAHVGSEDVDGRRCDHIRYSVGGRLYDVWVEEAPARLVRRVEPDMTIEEELYGKEFGMKFDITLVASLPVWESNPDTATAFQFVPPDGAEQVKRFGPVSPAERLAGTEAPDFTLPLLDGGEFTLSKARGSVVILDFWATWCGPCRIAMPVLSEVSKEFADKGVKLVSVDLEEDPADIKAFLETMNLDVTVALDTTSQVAASYLVDGIPQSVIVGPDGVIRIVHVGLWSVPDFSDEDTEEQRMAKMHAALADSLRAELKEILAGGSGE